MTNTKKLLLGLVISFILVISVKAQYINLNLKVESELTTSVEQELFFGTQLVNSGIRNVNLGDSNMGIFRIRGINSQNVYINLAHPEFLESETTSSSDRIPLELNLAYNNNGRNNPQNSTALNSNSGWISIHKNTDANQKNVKLWQELYIYLYGSIDIGDLSVGIYSADVLLTVDYD